MAKKSLKQVLSEYGFQKDSFSIIHDLAYNKLNDKSSTWEEKQKAGRLMISLAKEITFMERQLAPKVLRPQKTPERIQKKAAKLRLADLKVA